MQSQLAAGRIDAKLHVVEGHAGQERLPEPYRAADVQRPDQVGGNLDVIVRSFRRRRVAATRGRHVRIEADAVCLEVKTQLAAGRGR